MKNDVSIRAAIYLRAAELAEQKGICKHSYGYSDDGTRCSRGHLVNAALELFGNITALHAVENASDLEIMYFNDKPETTAAMVAAKLRELEFKE